MVRKECTSFRGVCRAGAPGRQLPTLSFAAHLESFFFCMDSIAVRRKVRLNKEVAVDHLGRCEALPKAVHSLFIVADETPGFPIVVILGPGLVTSQAILEVIRGKLPVDIPPITFRVTDRHLLEVLGVAGSAGAGRFFLVLDQMKRMLVSGLEIRAMTTEAAIFHR